MESSADASVAGCATRDTWSVADSSGAEDYLAETNRTKQTNSESQQSWDEADSRRFIERGAIFTPAREEVGETILSLIPVDEDEHFVGVDIGGGTGWLSRLILERFLHSRMLLLDGSEAMLQAAAQELKPFEDRLELRSFPLEDADWRERLPVGVRCFVSSLVIHHLDETAKAQLYADLYRRLSPPGVLLIFDCIAPASEIEQLEMADAWDREVRSRSLTFTSSLDAYYDFLESEWNWHRYPDDPVDKPSTIHDHLEWLREAGFNANVFWLRAGHAIYGGYKELTR